MIALQPPPLVLLGGSFNALSVARSLGSRGVAVHLLGDGRGLPAVARSRYVTTHLVTAIDADVSADWRHWLESGPCGAVILPTSDEGLEFLATNRQWLVDRDFRPVEGADDVMLTMLDKSRTYRLAHALGVPAPEAIPVGCLAECRVAADTVGYPCLLKPASSHRFIRAGGWRKGEVVATSRDLAPAYERLAAVGESLVLSEMVVGTDDSFCSYYSYLDAEGEPLLHFTKRKLRQFPIHVGNGSYHETAWEKEAAELGLRMFQRAGVRGIANIEFKRERRSQRLKLIECNLRLTAADDLLRRAGVDLGALAYRRAIGEVDQRPAGPPAPGGFREGLRQWLPRRDLMALVEYRRSGELTVWRWLGSMAHRQSTPLFDLDDLMPSIANAVGVAHRIVGRRSGARA